MEQERIRCNIQISREDIMNNVLPKFVPETEETMKLISECNLPIIRWNLGNFYVMFILPVFTDNPKTKGHINIDSELLSIYDISIMDLYTAAVLNIEQDVGVTKLDSYLFSFLDDIQPDIHSPLYLVYSKSGRYAPAGLLSKNVVDKIGEKLGTQNYYIIPSSVQELLVVPMDDCPEMTDQNLLEIIRDVNDRVLKPKEILSYSLFKHNEGGFSEIIGGKDEQDKDIQVS